ncbi:MAG: saccharopine dehydrogenase family protein [Candidatus Binatia bacterium]
MAEKLVSVLGATGYPGGLIVRELKRRGIPVLAAGRNPGKLQQLAAEVGGVETTKANVADRPSLDRLCQRSRVIINTAGPFMDYGEPVVRAAIASSTHYLDTTGEQPFMKAMLAHDEWARRQQVAVVCAQAFEIAVADCATAIAVEGFRDIARIEVTYITAFHASQGTQRTVVRMFESTGYAWVGGQWIKERPAKLLRFVDFPAPIGRIAAVSFPSAEVITIPRHVSVREVRVFMGLPVVAARVLSATAPLVQLAARSPLSRLAARFIGSGTGGPDDATRAQDTFQIAIDVRGTRDGAAHWRRLLVHGRDPYGLTAVIAAQAATQMCHGDYARAGVLPPATAFNPRTLLDNLKPCGLTYETQDDDAS